jgi:hypothetical protein
MYSALPPTQAPENDAMPMSKILLAKASAPFLPIALAIVAFLLAFAVFATDGFAAGYSSRAVCSAPAPGHAACLGMRLVPSTAAGSGAVPATSGTVPAASGTVPATSGVASPSGSTPEPPGLSPQQLHTAYDLPLESPLEDGEPQTIAIVDAYDDPHAEADLGVFDHQYGLPACTHANGCFTKVNQQGLSTPLPAANGEWSVEISTDVQVAHSLCENCHIVLVEASSDIFPNLEAAEDTAAALLQAASPPGTTTGEISNSWGGEEPSVDSSAFNHPGIVITASSGDEGYLNWDEYNERNGSESAYFDGPSYPASSPRVVAVGGTSLTVDNATGEWVSEKVWNRGNGAAGGGCSPDFRASSWQSQVLGWSAVGCGSHRAVADVAADADPQTGVEAYDSVPEGLGTSKEEPGEEPLEFFTIGGTSVASPIIASTFALAGGGHGVEYPAATLYANAGSAALHDITAGGNGECKGKYNGTPACSGSLASPLDCGAGNTICNAASGYDGPTGVGTPIGLSAFQPVPGQIEGPAEGPPSGGSGGGPGGPSGGGSGGSGGGGNGGTVTPGAGSSTEGSPSPTPSNVSKAKSSTTSQPRISGLSLTLGAVIALNRAHPSISKVAFSFALSAPVTVRITLARWVRVRGHWRWSTLRGTNSIAARAGVNHSRLRGRGLLPSGRYRLTLTPAHGIASSIAISID